MNPVIVELFRLNAPIKEFMVLFLAKQISYVECLEHSLIKLSEQYTGAMEGWKDQVKKLEAAKNAEVVVVKPPLTKTLRLTGKMAVVPIEQTGITDPLEAECDAGKVLVNEKRKSKICQMCGYDAPLIVGDGKRCAVCDARRGKNEYRHRSDKIIEAAQQLYEWCLDHRVPVPATLESVRQLPQEEKAMLELQRNRLT
jgi:hypothetical protein